MVIMASGITRGRVRTSATTTESRNLTAILQIGWQRHAALVYPVRLWYWTSISWLINTWPLAKFCFSIGSRARVRLTSCKQGRIVWKPNKANLGLKVNRIITFSSIQMGFFAALYCVYGDYLDSKQKAKQYTAGKPQCKVTKLKSQFYLFPG